ncbi:cupin domain-containing protein [Kushneria aurantia]|uniref:Cupin domain-containing protein n=1 Tax=Kushneria aurantia TaxID=504092 RepID=A0ABV6FZH1_9GAMM|nr:cupin domain-containing protein [Kushneria aurantia]
MKKPQTLYFQDDGRTPNSRFPVLLYRGFEASTPEALADHFEALYKQNGWPAQWRGGVFDYHHYHSRSHEVLGIYRGAATLRLGGENGENIEVGAGDVIVLPAGTGHCRISAGNDFALTAGYPSDQQDWDLCVSGETPIEAARERIAAVGLPKCDPVAGERGGVVSDWR